MEKQEKPVIVTTLSAIMDQSGRCVTHVSGTDESLIKLLSTVLAGHIAELVKAYKINPKRIKKDVFKDITELMDGFLKQSRN